VPVTHVPGCVRAVLPCVRRGAILTDVGSSKAWIVSRVENAMSRAETDGLLPPGVSFVPGHPMAGCERSGFEAASPSLFKGRAYAFTPCRHTSPSALDMCVRMARALGADPLVIDPDEHDEAVALTSHAPYLFAVALSSAFDDLARRRPELGPLAASAFSDATRVASSDPEMAAGMCSTNASHARRAVSLISRRLDALLSKLDDPPALRKELARSRPDGGGLQAAGCDGRASVHGSVSNQTTREGLEGMASNKKDSGRPPSPEIQPW